MVVGYTQAEVLDLPVGHPRDKVVYVGDPASPTVYYPAAEFHRKDVRAQILRGDPPAHGPRRNRADRPRRRELGLGLCGRHRRPDPTEVSERRPSARSRKSKDSSLLFKATLKPNAPEVPDGLVWYPRESAWREVAAGRIKYGLNDFLLHVRYTEDYGIDSAFESRIKWVKLSFGGEFKKAKETTWRIEGVFGT